MLLDYFEIKNIFYAYFYFLFPRKKVRLGVFLSYNCKVRARYSNICLYLPLHNYNLHFFSIYLFLVHKLS